MTSTTRHRSAGRPVSPGVIMSLVVFLGVIPASAATIDDFSTAQAQLTAPPRASSNVAGGMIGGSRDLAVEVLAGSDDAMVEVIGGRLILSENDGTPDTEGRASVAWDGGSDPDNLDPIGLGGMNLTLDDHTGFRLTIDAAGEGSEILIEVFTDGANASKAAILLHAVAATTTFDLSYNTFVPSLGSGADFSNVGAITMSITSVEENVEVDMLETVGAAIVSGDAVKVDTLVVDNDGDLRVDPGDTLRYTVTITNTGAEAEMVSLEDLIQPNLSVVADSLFTSPIAAPDTYLACGNLPLTVDDSALPGLTANDNDPDSEAFTIITSFPVATSRGGTVDNVDPVTGAFDYEPPVGFRGIDSFNYEIRDAGLRTSTTTVTLVVDSLIWFVDSDVATSGSGQMTSPFKTLGEAESASGPGDTIFVFAAGSDTGDGINLKDRQQLIGEGVGLTACGTQVVPPGARPILVNSSSTVVRLADGNRIAGLNVEPVGSEDAIVGDTIAGLDVVQVGIDTSRGGGIGNGGVRLFNTTGTITFDDLDLTGNGTGIAFSVIGGAPQITVANSALTPAGGGLLNIAGTTGGSVDFQVSNTLSLSSGSGNAVSLQSNAAIITIEDLGDLTTGSGGGLLIGSNAAVNLGTIADIAATGGPALDIASSTITKIGGGDLTLRNLSSTGSIGTGVSLSGVAPNLTVGGTTIVAASAGSGIDLTGSNGGVTFATVTIDGPGGHGVGVTNHSGPVTISGGSIGAMTAPVLNAVDIIGGSDNINIAAAVFGSPGARSVEITGRTGGAVTLTGNVTDPGLGINLTGNAGATITFAGILDLDTTVNQAFTAVGGGSVNVTGAGSDIDTTTGVGVRIENTDFGPSGVTFKSVSVTGAASGVVLNNTGAGGFFEITGDGPSQPANTTRGRIPLGTGGPIVLGSGGTLANTSGDAVSLTASANVTLRNMVLSNDGFGSRDGVSAETGSDNLVLDNMRITGFSDNGVLASASSGVALQHCEVETNAKSGDSIANNEANLRFDNVVGTADIDNSIIRDVIQDNIRVSTCEAGSCGGTLALTLDNVAVEDTLPGVGGNDGVLVRSFNDANVTLAVINSDLVRNRSSAIRHTTNDPATGGSTTVTNCDIDRNTHAVNITHQGATHTFNIANNRINQVVGTPTNYGNAVNIYLAGLSPAASLLQGHITGNTIGNVAISDSGSENGAGIDLYAAGAGTMTANVTGNTVRALRWGSAFRATSGTHTGAVNLTVKTNDFSVLPTTMFPLAGLNLNAGVVAGDTGTMCADITGNTAFIGDFLAVGAYINTFFGNPTVNLVGYGGADNDLAAVEAFLDTAATTVNPTPIGAFWTFFGAGTVQGQVGACTLPPAP